MSPHRDFDAARAQRARETDPLSFTLGGERFTCVAEPTLADTFALLAAPEPEDSERGAVQSILEFVGNLVVHGDRARWERMVKAQKRRGRRRASVPVSPSDVLELGAWLATEYTARPTRPSSDSSDGRPSTGGSSSSGSSSLRDETSPASG
jgi:hypothetical protein